MLAGFCGQIAVSGRIATSLHSILATLYLFFTQDANSTWHRAADWLGPEALTSQITCEITPLRAYRYPNNAKCIRIYTLLCTLLVTLRNILVGSRRLQAAGENCTMNQRCQNRL